MDFKELIRIYKDRVNDRRKAQTRRRRATQATPDSMGDLLSTFFKDNPLARRKIDESRVLMSWPSFVGEAAAQVSRAIKLRQGTLIVAVSDPVWMQQLFFLKTRLVRQYQQAYPKLGIKEIFFIHRTHSRR